MKRYLLSNYRPEGAPPPPEVLDRVMRDLEALNDAALEWGRRLALATTLPVEVRPFRDQH